MAPAPRLFAAYEAGASIKCCNRLERAYWGSNPTQAPGEAWCEGAGPREEHARGKQQQGPPLKDAGNLGLLEQLGRALPCRLGAHAVVLRPAGAKHGGNATPSIPQFSPTLRRRQLATRLQQGLQPAQGQRP